MNDADVGKQVQQMVRFILQEADEKASEITVAAEEEFSIEKLQLVESEKRRVRQEYERKEKQVDVRRKIEYSTELNAARIKLLQAQDDVVTGVKESAGDALLRVTKDANAYKRVLKGLIVQSLLRLREPALVLRCRETDRSLVEAVLEVAKKEYAEKAKVNLPKVIIDGKFYLPPQRSSRDDAHGPSCSGGVVLASQDGKIVCDNTLDARLSVSFRQKLPEIRKKLFSHQVSQ
ncbi:V-type proton ATPase subunit E-like isoform X2 [Miscanthus floridulus]|uniref:V-type proton ATPase subunit E-like isoform X2 n=1 Tax=Miscanthus floridulus TaxID=154761 RepID=UPI00345B34AA